jgi:hypothetical protein
MKRKARLALFGAVLHGGAAAALPVVQSAPSAAVSKAQPAAQQPPPPVVKKKRKSVRNKQPVETPKAASGVEGTPTPTDQVEQSVQLKGVRG